MRLVKLDTTSSTNDFLKELAASQPLENFTVVSAENQTNGRGQMGAKWQSEIGKNLIMSVFIKDSVSSSGLFTLNVAVALSIISGLETFGIPNLAIKWPNDIMSGHKKIGGILIENIFKGDGNIVSIAGLGLNVNQTNFLGLPKATSLAVITGKTFNKEKILERIVANLEKNVAQLQHDAQSLWDDYHTALFKKGIPMPFEDGNGKQFMAIIKAVEKEGRLELLLDDGHIQAFAIKEIQMLY